MSGLFGSAASAASATSNALGDLKSDVALSDPPTDTITALSFSPGQSQQDFLAISSWDNKVRIYEINQNGQSQGRHAFEHSQPVFDCDFSKVSSCALVATLRRTVNTNKTIPPGWNQDRLRISRQECQGLRPRLAAGHCHWHPRPARALVPLFRQQRHPHGGDGLVGQDGQVLGSASAGRCGYPAVPGARVHGRCARQPVRRGHRRPLHQHYQPQGADQDLQDAPEPAQMADQSS